MIFRILCVALVASLCLAGDLDIKEHWGKFKSTFKKSFKSESHEEEKKDHFESKVKSILKHNLEADMGEHPFKMAVNEFTDMPYDEFSKTMLGLKLPENKTYNFPPANVMKSERSLPANFDWRSYGAVSSVKNQGSCGSCWTFAVSGAMEGAYARKYRSMVEFSQQQLLDCSGNYGTGGCNGGWPDDAYKYIKDYGIETAQCYPYRTQQQYCTYNGNCVQTGISNYYDVPHDEATLQEYLYYYGPMSVCVYVNSKMQSYSGGIFYDTQCTGSVNHAVLLVGYGTENGWDYWTIKNSWGPGWGENGYIRIARNANNMCKITDYAAFPYI